jgi:hypothetical protein
VVAEKLTPQKVLGIFSWGSFKDVKEGWQRAEGRIEGDKIILEWTIGPSKRRLSLFTKNGKTAFVDYIEDGSFRRGWIDRKQ